MKSIKKTGGFTLVELIIVIAILAVLASIAVPNLLGSVEKSRIAKDEANAKLIGDAIVMAVAEGEITGDVVGAQIRDGIANMNVVKKIIDPLPKPVSKKYYGAGNYGYYWYKIEGEKVTVFTQTQTTITELYPEVKDTVSK